MAGDAGGVGGVGGAAGDSFNWQNGGRIQCLQKNVLPSILNSIYQWDCLFKILIEVILLLIHSLTLKINNTWTIFNILSLQLNTITRWSKTIHSVFNSTFRNIQFSFKIQNVYEINGCLQFFARPSYSTKIGKILIDPNMVQPFWKPIQVSFFSPLRIFS